MGKHLKKLNHIEWYNVKITGGFWKKRIEINENVTIPVLYERCKKTGRIDSIKCIYKPGDTKVPKPHHYWDSDVAKWVEAAAYSLKYKPDERLKEKIDEIVNDFERLQQPDGYINTYFTVVEPGKRWTNVYVMHELYCAGHLIEAAISYYQATGEKKFLELCCKYADYIDSVFGPAENQIHGYPGHQEIELALVKLYRVTGEKRYLNLAKYFLDERGKRPFFFEEEAIKYGRDPEDGGPKGILAKSFLPKGPYALFQSHLPIREQDSAEGHAVRLMYMCSGAADVAIETGDESLLEACRKLWDNVTLKRMYITGGVGSEEVGERFSFDYHLPNETAYCETCAAIGLVMFASRMLQAEPNRKYADIMEKALYNAVISGVSLSGDKFFYANHLASHPGLYENGIIRNPRMFPERQEWFDVVCCPMNLARLTESIGGYIYSMSQDGIYVHLYIDSEVTVNKNGYNVFIKQNTDYPWSDEIKINVDTDYKEPFRLYFRIPSWCRNPEVEVDGRKIPVESNAENGYVFIEKNWCGHSLVRIKLPMEPLLVEAHPSVWMNCGKVAIQHGPLIYCLEEIDNGKDVFDIYLNRDSKMLVEFIPDLLGGINCIKVHAKRRSKKLWENALYRPVVLNDFEDVIVTAIPYYAWGNRQVGEMTVWVNWLYG